MGQNFFRLYALKGSSEDYTESLRKGGSSLWHVIYSDRALKKISLYENRIMTAQCIEWEPETQLTHAERPEVKSHITLLPSLYEHTPCCVCLSTSHAARLVSAGLTECVHGTVKPHSSESLALEGRVLGAKAYSQRYTGLGREACR